MKMKFLWIPARDSAAAEAELNTFLCGHRVVQVEKAFCSDADGPGWALCVQWLPAESTAASVVPKGGSKVDYREVLDEPTFKLFAALRHWRKERAAADGVPIYTVATNEQLAAIATGRITTKAALEKVEGFGAGRMTKYADALLAVCMQEVGP